MRIAALDLGSNSFHLLVADSRPDGSFVPVSREKEVLRLGEVVARTGCIGPRAGDAALAAVRRFRALAEAAGADALIACATSAFRDAADGSELLGRFRIEAGVDVRILTGGEEARLVFRAVQGSVLLEPGPALCLDLGGGSLEVMVGTATAMPWAASVGLGVGRLTAELVRHDPPTGGDVRRLRTRIVRVLERVAGDAGRFGPTMLVGTSGTFVDLARMAAYREAGTVPVSVNQRRVTRDAVASLHKDLIGQTAARRRKTPGLDARRAELMPAGSLVALVAMDVFGFDEIVVGEWALREGMVLDALDGAGPAARPADSRGIRAASVLDLCRRCGWREGHARQVARLAVRLFDATADLHRLSDHHRELLEHAALLHDIGEHVAGEDHDKHTAYLIQHGRLRGFSPQEILLLATLGRYHRRGSPKPSFEPYAALDARERPAARFLTALLQLADGLDRTHAATVETVEVTVRRDRVVVTVRATGDVDLEVWGVRRKRALFERVTGRRLEIEVAAAPSRSPRWGERRGA